VLNWTYKKDCDNKTKKLAFRFYETAKKLKIKCAIECMVPRKAHGEEPSPEVASALKKADAAILLTSMSLSHTKARKIASSLYLTIPSCSLKILS